MHLRASTLARGTALAVTAALPLAAWPGLDTPFSTPKLWLLACGVLVCGTLGSWSAGPCRAGVRRRAAVGGAGTVAGAGYLFAIVVPLWCATWALAALGGDLVSLPALTLGAGAALWALVLAGTVRDPRHVMTAQAAGSSVVALVAVLQWLGHDPFAAAGWTPAIAGGTPRLAVYGTLGNPNFVACLMAASLPMSAGLAYGSTTAARWLAVTAATLQVLALLASGSRAGAVALGAAALTWAVAVGGRRHRAVTLTALTLAATAVAISPARPLADTISGRFYIWRTAWPHALERPITGRGPGAFEASYPEWERAARAAGDARPGVARFAGPQQHAHNDYLEALVDRGVPGAAALAFAVVGMLLAAVRRARRAAGSLPALAGAASLAALAAAAVVDFPLARPAEAVHFWTAMAVIAMGGPETSRPAPIDPEAPQPCVTRAS
jgi:hypothetical protein